MKNTMDAFRMWLYKSSFKTKIQTILISVGIGSLGGLFALLVTTNKLIISICVVVLGALMFHKIIHEINKQNL